MAANQGVQRSAAWIEREYGTEKWPAVERLVEEALGSGRRELGEVVLQIARGEFGRAGSLEPKDVVIANQAMTVPGAVAVGAYQQVVVEQLLARCTPSTDLVVELGAGWGRNLCLAWLAGGPRHARYVAAEFTEAGRRVVDRLATLAPDLRLESRAFDLRHPDLADLAGAREAVVLTVHGTEQVDHLPGELVEEIRGLAATVTCVHLESVGWQLGGSTGSSEAYAARNDYNRNLVALLEAEAARGTIEILAREVDVIGLNPANATSAVVWRSPA